MQDTLPRPSYPLLTSQAALETIWQANGIDEVVHLHCRQIIGSERNIVLHTCSFQGNTPSVLVMNEIIQKVACLEAHVVGIS